MTENNNEKKPTESLVLRLYKNPTLRQLFRYGITATVSYGFILVSMYFAVDVWGFPKRVSYGVINAINYIGVYISFCKFVFNDAMETRTLVRFAFFLGISWLVSYCFFWVLDHFFNLHYVAIVILNIIILGSIRFFTNKKYVFRA